MIRQWESAFAACLAFAAPSAPAAAQNLIPTTARTVPAGDLRFTAYPIQLFGRDGSADSAGAGWRLGYGITHGLDVSAKAALFDRLSLVGFDSTLRVARGEVDFAASLGAHKALIADGPNTTALDAAWLLGKRLAPHFRLLGGMALSLESLDHVRHSGFTRIYLVPGVDLRLTRRITLVSQLGLGLNDDSPNYLMAGLSFHIPVSGHGADW